MAEMADKFVSRETSERLDDLAEQVLRWTKVINLIGRGSKDEIVRRHIIDSIGFWRNADTAPNQHWGDLGTGGGFPGLVVAIIAKEEAPKLKLTLVESDQRKSAFLRTMTSRFDLPNCSVASKRIETLPELSADVISARALAPLGKLLEYVQRHLKGDGLALLAKGEKAEDEIFAARKSWSFQYEHSPSIIDSTSTILRVWDIEQIDD